MKDAFDPMRKATILCGSNQPVAARRDTSLSEKCGVILCGESR
jgi:hypothetical protein